MTTKEFVDFMFDEWQKLEFDSTFMYLDSAKEIDDFRYRACEDLKKVSNMSEAERLDATRMWLELAVSLVGGDYWSLALRLDPPSYADFDEHVKIFSHCVEQWH